MQENKVRRVTVDNGRSNPMNYVVGGQHPIPQKNNPIEKDILVVLEITETEAHFLVYLVHKDNSVQLWKKVPKNEYTTPEYFID